MMSGQKQGCQTCNTSAGDNELRDSLTWGLLQSTQVCGDAGWAAPHGAVVREGSSRHPSPILTHWTPAPPPAARPGSLHCSSLCGQGTARRSGMLARAGGAGAARAGAGHRRTAGAGDHKGHHLPQREQQGEAGVALSHPQAAEGRGPLARRVSLSLVRGRPAHPRHSLPGLLRCLSRPLRLHCQRARGPAPAPTCVVC